MTAMWEVNVIGSQHTPQNVDGSRGRHRTRANQRHSCDPAASGGRCETMFAVGPLLGEVEIAERGGEPQPVRVQIYLDEKAPNPNFMTARNLRHIRFGELLNGAREEHVGCFPPSTMANLRAAARKGGRTIDLELLLSVSDAYTRAVRDHSRTPVKEAAAKVGIRDAEASKLIRQSRKRGFLPPTKKSVAKSWPEDPSLLFKGREDSEMNRGSP